MRNHFMIVLATNLLFVGMLVNKAWEGNDKAPLLFLLVYPLLILINLLAWIILKALNRRIAVVYKTTTQILLLLLIPALLLSTLY